MGGCAPPAFLVPTWKQNQLRDRQKPLLHLSGRNTNGKPTTDPGETDKNQQAPRGRSGWSARAALQAPPGAPRPCRGCEGWVWEACGAPAAPALALYPTLRPRGLQEAAPKPKKRSGEEPPASSPARQGRAPCLPPPLPPGTFPFSSRARRACAGGGQQQPRGGFSPSLGQIYNFCFFFFNIYIYIYRYLYIHTPGNSEREKK